MRKLLLTAAVLLPLSAAALADNTTVTIDLSKLRPADAADVLEAKQKAEDVANGVKLPTTAAQTKEWAEAGKGVADAIGATAHALNIEVNEFVKTPVGWWASFFLFWYLIGGKLWTIFGGGAFLMVVWAMAWKLNRHFLLGKYSVIRTLPDGTKEYGNLRYEWRDGDAKTYFSVFILLLPAGMTLIYFFVAF